MMTNHTFDTIRTEAKAWFSLASQVAVFDVQAKARQAYEFSLRIGAHGFAIPTKLSGVTRFQEALRSLQAIPHTHKRLIARLRPDTRRGRAGQQRVMFYFGGEPLGYLQDKHLPWFAELFSEEGMHGLSFFVTEVTGGTWDKPTRGCNIVIAGAGEAAVKYLDRMEQRRVTTAAV
jgi:hypothetical protein